MSEPTTQEVLSNLARVKATFQLRTLVSVLGLPPLTPTQERIVDAAARLGPDFQFSLMTGRALAQSPPCVSHSITGKTARAVIIDDPEAPCPNP